MSELDRIGWFGVGCTLLAILLVLMFGGGCAGPAAREVRVPVLVAPSCEPTNVFERCIIECMSEFPRQQAHVAWESASAYRCYCKPWDS